jgi:hypothetical protein
MLDDGGWELVAGIRDRLHPGRLSLSLTEHHCSCDNARPSHQTKAGAKPTGTDENMQGIHIHHAVIGGNFGS